MAEIGAVDEQLLSRLDRGIAQPPQLGLIDPHRLAVAAALLGPHHIHTVVIGLVQDQREVGVAAARQLGPVQCPVLFRRLGKDVYLLVRGAEAFSLHGNAVARIDLGGDAADHRSAAAGGEGGRGVRIARSFGLIRRNRKVVQQLKIRLRHGIAEIGGIRRILCGGILLARSGIVRILRKLGNVGRRVGVVGRIRLV